MATTIVQINGLPYHLSNSDPNVAEVDYYLDSRSPRGNVVCDLVELHSHLPTKLSALADDFVDVATAVYLADVAVKRGTGEHSVRDIELVVLVRRLEFWQSVADQFLRLLWWLTGDSFELTFHRREAAPDRDDSLAEASSFAPLPDCVCLLSGGLDSLAGAVTLLQAGRHPHLVVHRSDTVGVQAAQDSVRQLLAKHWPDRSVVSSVRIGVDAGRPQALPYPEPCQREHPGGARFLLYMTLGAVTAAAAGLQDVYVFQNGVSGTARASPSAHGWGPHALGVHPAAVSGFNDLCQQAGWDCRIHNPFTYQTQAELLRGILRPALTTADIQRTVSCEMVSRACRQCGHCIRCLLRRTAMLAAGLPDEAYAMDLLGDPLAHTGTSAFASLVSLLSYAGTVHAKNDEELLQRWPWLLDFAQAGLSIFEVIATLRRHTDEVEQVITEHFPQAANILAE